MTAAPPTTNTTEQRLPPERAPALEFRGLVKDFRIGLRGVKLRAVDHLSLSVAPGQVYGLLGPNGSGKSTALKCVLGLLQPTAGEALLDGQPGGDLAVRRNLGFLPEAPYFYRFLTGRETVVLAGKLCGLHGSELDGRTAVALAEVGLTAAADRKVGTYSKGMLQRLGLAQAVVHDPEVLVLDEPTAGMDPLGAADLGERLKVLKAQGKTIVLCSHLLAQVEELCDRVAVMHRGRLLVEGPLNTLLERPDLTRLTVRHLPASALPDLESWLGQQGASLVDAAPARAPLTALFRERVDAAARTSQENPLAASTEDER